DLVFLAFQGECGVAADAVDHPADDGAIDAVALLIAFQIVIAQDNIGLVALLVRHPEIDDAAAEIGDAGFQSALALEREDIHLLAFGCGAPVFAADIGCLNRQRSEQQQQTNIRKNTKHDIPSMILAARNPAAYCLVAPMKPSAALPELPWLS